MDTSRLLGALLATLVLVGALSWFGAEPAVACSCERLAPNVMLANYDGAFIGVATDVSETSFRFDVEQWLRGDQQTETIEIVRDPEEDTCGFSPPVGTSLAVFFNDAGRNGFRSGLCGTADADLVRAALTPPAVDPNAGPGSLLIAESPAPTHLWLFDSVGRLAAVASPPEDFDRDRQLLFVEPCPGGEVIVEAWWGTPQVLVVRDLATMAPVRATTLSAERDVLQSIACLDETGDNLAAAFGVGYGKDLTIIDPDSDAVIASVLTPESSFALTSMSSERQVAVYLSEDGLRSIDLRTGEVTLLDALASFVGDQEYDPFAFGELSPDGTKFVVYFNELMTVDGTVKRGVLLADLVSGDISTQVIYGPGSDGVTWLGNDEVWVLGDYNGALVIDAATADVSEIDQLCAGPCEFQLDHAQTSSEDFVVATNGAVLTVDRSTRKPTELAQIPITRWAQVLPLKSAVTVAARTEVTTVDFTQGASESAVVGNGASPTPVDDPVSGTTALLLGAGAVLVLTTGVAGFELRRRNTRDR